MLLNNNKTNNERINLQIKGEVDLCTNAELFA